MFINKKLKLILNKAQFRKSIFIVSLVSVMSHCISDVYAMNSKEEEEGKQKWIKNLLANQREAALSPEERAAEQ
jgi:hypothetical protein